MQAGQGRENVLHTKRGVAFALFALLTATGVAAQAGPTPEQECASTKLLAAGTKASKKLSCYRKVVEDYSAVSARCLQRAEQAFDDAFARADDKGTCPGDTAEVEGQVDDYVDSILSALPDDNGDAAQTCTAKKLQATGKKAKRKLKCYAKAVRKGEPVDEKCLEKAETKFDEAFAKAEEAGGCTTVGDADEIEQETDDFVGEVTLDVSCGNGVIDPGEECEGDNLDGQQCTDLQSPNPEFNFNGGTLSCNSSCQFNTYFCTYCGDGVKNDGEQCDGSDFGGADCSSETGGSLPAGDLSCADNCTIDASDCHEE